MLLELTLQLRQMNKGLCNGGTVFRGEVRLQRAENFGVLQIRLQRAENLGVLQIRALPRTPFKASCILYMGKGSCRQRGPHRQTKTGM